MTSKQKIKVNAVVLRKTQNPADYFG